MMKNKISYLLFAVILISISSCYKKRDLPNSNNFFPLKIGNTWLYEESYFYPATSDTALYIHPVKIIITKDTILQNGEVAFIAEEQRSNTTYRYLWYIKGEDFIEQNLRSGTKVIKYKSTMKKGLSWDMYPDFPNTNFATKEVIVQYDKFAFLNTTAFAYKIRHGNPNLNDIGQNGELMEEVFAPGIGLLESNYQINYYGPSLTRLVLTDYYIN